MARHLKILCIAATASLGACASLGTTDNRDVRMDVDSDFVLSEIALADGRTEDAGRELLTAAKLSNEAFYAERAARLAQDQHLDELGSEAAARWLEIAPDNERAHWFAGIFALRANKIDDAVMHMTRMLQSLLPVENADTGLRLILETLGLEANASGATVVMSRLVEAFPGYADGYYGVARLAMRSGDFDLALENARRAMELDPDWPDAQLLYARALLAAGRSDESLEIAGRLADEDPSPDVQLQYAELLLSAGHNDDAKKILDSILADNPGLPDATRALAFLSMTENDLDEAKSLFEQLRQDPQYGTEAFFYLGRIAETQENYLQATRAYSRVVEGSHAVEAQLRTARIMLDELDDAEGALRHLEEFGIASPDFATEMLVARAELLVTMDRQDDAFKLIDEAMQKNPSDETLHEAHVRVYLALVSRATDDGDFVKAESILGEALGKYPDNASLRYSLALVYEDQDRPRKAAALLEDLVKEQPDNPAILNALGYLLTDRFDRYDRAHDYIRRALAMDPDNAAIIDSMGWVLYKLGDYEAARDYLERAYRLVTDPEMAAHLVEVYWALGDRDQALQLLEANLTEFPDSSYLNEVSHRLLNQ